MSANPLRLGVAPIVEAVLDLDCDLPPRFEIGSLEAPGRTAYAEAYPVFQAQYLDEFLIEAQNQGTVTHSARQDIHALQWMHPDKKQIVQVRPQGYSFNRLEPYTTLDDYLGEIKRTWDLYVAVVRPIQIREVRLRYINRILLPLVDGKVDFGEFFETGPKLPTGSKLAFTGFLNQHSAVEEGTGNLANIVLTTLPPADGKLPIIFDIGVSHPRTLEIGDWAGALTAIQSLRSLKNRIFENTLTQRCLNLFQPSGD